MSYDSENTVPNAYDNSNASFVRRGFADQTYHFPIPAQNDKFGMEAHSLYRVHEPPFLTTRFISNHPHSDPREDGDQYVVGLNHHAQYSAHSPYDHSTSSTASHHRASPQSWPSYDNPTPTDIMPNTLLPWSMAYPSSSPFPPPRLTPPPIRHSSSDVQANTLRMNLAGSLDPSTGIFYRTPEHPRLRTAQACEKCRARKAKCTGECPCGRCASRGLVCEYAKEGRVRGPNKPKNKHTSSGPEEVRMSSLRRSASENRESTRLPPSSQSRPMNTSFTPPDGAKRSSPSVHSSHRPSRTIPQSLGEHRSTRPRPPNLDLEEIPYRRVRSPMKIWENRDTGECQVPMSMSYGLPGAETTPRFDDPSSAISLTSVSSFGRDDAGAIFPEAAYLHRQQDDCLGRGGSDGGGMLSNPHSAVSLTFSSPHTTSTERSSPIPPAPLIHYSREGDHISSSYPGSLPSEMGSQFHPDLGGHSTGGTQALEPVWAEVRHSARSDFDGGHKQGNSNGH